MYKNIFRMMVFPEGLTVKANKGEFVRITLHITAYETTGELLHKPTHLLTQLYFISQTLTSINLTG